MLPVPLSPGRYPEPGPINQTALAPLGAIREANPELASWTLEQIADAWADYSDLYFASFLSLPNGGRLTEFVAFLYGAQTAQLSHEPGVALEQVRKIEDAYLRC